jgi:hypothetical protein
LSFSFLNNEYKIYNRPLFFFGNSVVERKDSKNLLSSFLIFLKNKLDFYSYNLVSSFPSFFSTSYLIYNNKRKVRIKSFIYDLGEFIIKNSKKFEYTFIVYQGFLNNLFDVDVVLPIAGPYELDMLYMNIEGRFRYMKQIIQSNLSLYSNWEVIFLFDIYNKKKNILKYSFFFFFNKIKKYFKYLLNYFCNFFLSLDKFFFEFFFSSGNNKLSKNILSDFIIISNFISFKVKIFNNIFNLFINNYYSTDFFLKNSKIMSYCSLKKYTIFK